MAHATYRYVHNTYIHILFWCCRLTYSVTNKLLFFLTDGCFLLFAYLSRELDQSNGTLFFWTLCPWTTRDIGTPITVLLGWWRAKPTRQRPVASTPTRIHRTPESSWGSRSFLSRKWSWLIMKWINMAM